MKSKFPAHFRPSDDDFKKIWSDCIFAVDANVLLNLYRYSTETRTLLESTLNGLQDRLFMPNQAAKEFLKNRLIVTASQADEYTKAIRLINDLSQQLANKKKHPFLPDKNLPEFSDQVTKVVDQLEKQKNVLLDRLINDEILEFVSSLFENKTGNPYDENQLKELAIEGGKRYENEIPPGYKDIKKDASGDPYRKYGDLLVWKQIIDEAKLKKKSIVFITDDKKEDWWLEQSGRTISPRTELREEFISEVGNDFWMYTVDRFIEEAGRVSNTVISENLIAEIIQVSNEAKEQRIYSYIPQSLKPITRDLMLEKLEASEKWVTQNNREFIGLTSFVRNYLGQQGFDYSSSFDLIHQLEEQGLIELYDYHSADYERPVKAIRRITEDTYVNRPLHDLKNIIDKSSSKI